MSSKELSPLDELSVGARLDETGLNAKAKSRALTAIDRLVGGVFDLFGADIEGKRDYKRARHDAREALIKRAGELAIAQMEASPAVLAAVVDDLIVDQSRKLRNREAVARAALTQLSENASEHAAEGEPRLDDDWLNVFARHAEDASSDRLRSMWGAILAGEIRSQGSFSLNTLRFVATLDKETAEAFERVVKNVFDHDGLVFPDVIQGHDMEDVLLLQECGLIHREYSGVKFFDADEDGDLLIKVRDRVIVVNTEPNSRIEIRSDYLTRVGREIYSILPPEDDGETAAEIVRRIPKSDIKSIHVVERDPETSKFREDTLRRLWPEP